MDVRESLLLTDMRSSFLVGEINLSLENNMDEGETHNFSCFSPGILSPL